MNYSWVATTCTGDPQAWGQLGGAGVGAPMRERKALLEEEIIPAAIASGFDELLVGGRSDPETVEMFPDVRFVEVEPQILDRREAFHIRDVCADLLTGDVCVFQTDDHRIEPGFLDQLKNIPVDWDVLTPQRLHGVTGEVLNNGEAEGYSGFHCNIFRRWVWEKVPFQSVTIHYADVSMSRIWREQGAILAWTPLLTVTDLEIKEGQL